MKTKLIAFFACLLVITAIVAAPFGFSQYIVINSSSAAPAQLTNGTQKVRSVTLIGKKDFQTDNTGTVYVGFGLSTDAKQGLTILSGGSVTIRSITGNDTMYLSNIWFDVSTVNDGLLVIWEP